MPRDSDTKKREGKGKVKANQKDDHSDYMEEGDLDGNDLDGNDSDEYFEPTKGKYSGDYDEYILWDLNDQIDIKTILGSPMTSRCIPWVEGMVYIGIDLTVKLDQLYFECRGLCLFNAKGAIWDISYSNYQPYLAAAISDGHIKLTNPSSRKTEKPQAFHYVENEEKEYICKSNGSLNFYSANIAVQKVQ
ncbi:hypothetical protein BGX27_005149 [Mortierella sp. AM989]|nr:hypothetical protein BGX27_005149 [Mortierella sp. AM989]